MSRYASLLDDGPRPPAPPDPEWNPWAAVLLSGVFGAIIVAIIALLIGCGSGDDGPQPIATYCAQENETCRNDAFDYCNGHMACMRPLEERCDTDYRSCIGG